MKKHIIIAPHADDEIIGCHAILNAGEVTTVAFPHKNKLAEVESIPSKKEFDFHIEHFTNFEDIMDLATRSARQGGFIFFPDPNYELHPDHRMIGAWGERLVKEEFFNNVVFYTTNMNAPYMQETKSIAAKGRALSECYPEKASLWKYDHKYFLFEGYCRYGIPLEL